MNRKELGIALAVFGGVALGGSPAWAQEVEVETRGSVTIVTPDGEKKTWTFSGDDAEIPEEVQKWLDGMPSFQFPHLEGGPFSFRWSSQFPSAKGWSRSMPSFGFRQGGDNPDADCDEGGDCQEGSPTYRWWGGAPSGQAPKFPQFGFRFGGSDEGGEESCDEDEECESTQRYWGASPWGRGFQHSFPQFRWRQGTGFDSNNQGSPRTFQWFGGPDASRFFEWKPSFEGMPEGVQEWLKAMPRGPGAYSFEFSTDDEGECDKGGCCGQDEEAAAPSENVPQQFRKWLQAKPEGPGRFHFEWKSPDADVKVPDQIREWVEQMPREFRGKSEGFPFKGFEFKGPQIDGFQWREMPKSFSMPKEFRQWFEKQPQNKSPKKSKKKKNRRTVVV